MTYMHIDYGYGPDNTVEFVDEEEAPESWEQDTHMRTATSTTAAFSDGWSSRSGLQHLGGNWDDRSRRWITNDSLLWLGDEDEEDAMYLGEEEETDLFADITADIADERSGVVDFDDVAKFGFRDALGFASAYPSLVAPLLAPGEWSHTLLQSRQSARFVLLHCGDRFAHFRQRCLDIKQDYVAPGALKDFEREQRAFGQWYDVKAKEDADFAKINVGVCGTQFKYGVGRFDNSSQFGPGSLLKVRVNLTFPVSDSRMDLPPISRAGSRALAHTLQNTEYILESFLKPPCDCASSPGLITMDTNPLVRNGGIRSNAMDVSQSETVERALGRFDCFQPPIEIVCHEANRTWFWHFLVGPSLALGSVVYDAMGALSPNDTVDFVDPNFPRAPALFVTDFQGIPGNDRLFVFTTHPSPIDPMRGDWRIPARSVLSGVAAVVLGFLPPELTLFGDGSAADFAIERTKLWTIMESALESTGFVPNSQKFLQVLRAREQTLERPLTADEIGPFGLSLMSRLGVDFDDQSTWVAVEKPPQFTALGSASHFQALRSPAGLFGLVKRAEVDPEDLSEIEAKILENASVRPKLLDKLEGGVLTAGSLKQLLDKRKVVPQPLTQLGRQKKWVVMVARIVDRVFGCLHVG